MKNKFGLFIGISALMVAVLGCSYYNPLQGSSNTAANDNRSLSDKAIESTLGGEKIGIPECDEIIDFFAEQSKSKDDNYFTKATREYVLNTVRESFKQSLEENKNDKVKMAKECRKYKDQIDKYKSEEDKTKTNSSNSQ